MKKLLKMLAIIICLALALGVFTGCSGGGEEEQPPEDTVNPIDIGDTIWSVEGILYAFYTDGTLLYEVDGAQGWGTYDWDGTTGYMHIEGTDTYFAVYSDSSVYMQGEDGYDYLMSYEGEIEEVPEPEYPIVESTDEYDYYEYEDGSMDFNDKVRNISFSTAPGMTVILSGIGETTDGVLIGNNAEGYVILDNVTNEWTEYSGSSSEYLYDYIDNFMGEFFSALYGDVNDLTYSEIDGLNENELAAYELNVWNDSYDVQIVVILYMAEDGGIIAASYFAPYGDDAQLDALYAGVTNINGPY